ncbi:hypothetical protein SRABI27_03694 [Pedobacter sp. Bi27]|uniref:hypothetical protein n=1 Tax=Pedobacter sp. Bi27 TaxID=2822351 RepID=UPI001E09E216|nr:hypothetical protein [Pedobacter sp. Bi27]CAH0278145.1 hypothetical protein SRABI27_03694 [Pedobacter sp. Bi27]
MSGLNYADHKTFSKYTLKWKELHFIKKNIKKREFVRWFRSQYDFIICYHGCRPKDVSEYYRKGFFPSNFPETMQAFEQLLDDTGYHFPYDVSHVLETYQGKTNRFVYVILDDEDFIDRAPHYIIYGSETMLSLAENVSPTIKTRLRNTGIPTIFHLKVPLARISDCELVSLYQQIVSSNGSMEQRRLHIFSNYTIIIEPSLGADCIIGHSHPTDLLYDQHARQYYQNKTARCCACST